MARDFARAELRPHVERWDHERALDASVQTQLGELGFFGMAIPEQFGGMELAADAVAAILQEMAWGEPAVAVILASHTRAAMLLLEHGTDAQRGTWLERMATGDVVACMAVAEDDAGSDIGTAQATARRTDTGFVLDGEKRWVSNGSAAAIAITLAKLDDAPALFVVELDADGVTRGDREDTMGLRSLDVIGLSLVGCPVSAETLIGGSADASTQLASSSAFDAMSVAAMAVGISEAALEHAIGYADIREQFGSPLRAFEGIQFKLADMATRTAAARALLHAAAVSGDRQQLSMAKLYASASAMEVTTQAVQIYGGYGYMRDYPVEKTMRDAKAMGIMGGSDEMLRVAVAEALYRS